MSIETWKAEFYPEEAADAAEKGAIHAIQHSIVKWKGLREDQLKKHGLTANNTHLREAEGLSWEIDSRNCALCCLDEMGKGRCKSCPIYLCTGRECQDEYILFRGTNQPEPMIALLERTLTWAEKQPPEILDPPT